MDIGGPMATQLHSGPSPKGTLSTGPRTEQGKAIPRMNAQPAERGKQVGRQSGFLFLVGSGPGEMLDSMRY